MTSVGPASLLGLSQPTRVVIVQPSLGKYRVPVFRQLAGRPNVSLRVVHGVGLGVPNAPAEGFEAVEERFGRVRIGGHPFYWQRAQLRELRDADVAILTWDVHYLSLLPALARARRRGVGTILWGHGYSKNESPMRRRLRNWLGSRADAVLLYNQTGARKAIEAGVDPERVFVAPNTIDTSEASAARALWLRDPQRLRLWQQEQGLEGPVLLHVSRYTPQRRIEMLLDAAVALRQEFPGLRVVLVGKGYDGPPVSAEIQRRGLGGTVLTPGAIYDEQELAPYFLTARAMTFPANIGLSLHHAFAYGLPVVTHGDRDSQAPELEALVDGENGLLYKKDDLEDFIGKLRMLLTNDGLRHGLGVAAMDSIRDHWSLTAMVDGMMRAIEYVRRLQPG